MGRGTVEGVPHVGPTDPDTAIDIDDLSDDVRGKNRLQGTDQMSASRPREREPGGQRKTMGVVESFESINPKKRGGQG
jgi:hypothetical protein